jgi:hypothetical protein
MPAKYAKIAKDFVKNLAKMGSIFAATNNA